MLNPMELTNKSILVTGASSGIGRETATLLSNLGARVIAAGRNNERLRQTLRMLTGEGHRIESFDLQNTEDIPQWMKKITDDTGPLHGLVHCAGTQLIRPVRITSTEHIDEMMKINVTAALHLAKGFRQKGVSAKEASIVFVSSVMGMVGQSGQAAYSASKGALIMLTKALALELVRDEIRVNCVAPAIVHTELYDRMKKALTPEHITAIEAMHPLGIGTPRDVAYAIAFLLGKTARWITGTALIVDGGYTAQ